MSNTICGHDAAPAPSAEDVMLGIQYMKAVNRTVVYETYSCGTVAAISLMPDDESGSTEVAYGIDHVAAFTNLALTLKRNGLADSVRTESHVDYPHEHGYLIGCGGCEARCVCADEPTWSECVWSGHDTEATRTGCPEFDADGSCIHSDHMMAAGR